MSATIDRNYFAARRAEMDARLLADPADRGAQFFRSAYAAYEAEAEDQLILQQHARAGELLDLRFIGPQVEDGTFPLRQMLDIVGPLERGLHHGAYRLRYGAVARQVDDDTRDTMGLQFAGLAHGSARVLVVGDGRPDLTGVNILSATLTQVFRLLTAPAVDFLDAVDAVGGPAARCIGDALRSTERHGLAAEFTCQRDDAPWLAWQGRPDEIRRVRQLIDSTQEPEVFEEELQGVVAQLADSGSIQVRMGEEKARVRFPLRLMHQVQRLQLAQPARLQVSTARYWDAVLKREVFKRTLIEVR